MNGLSGICFKISSVGIRICLFAGGITLVGYMAGILIGGDLAENLCIWIFDRYLPLVIKFTAVSVGIGLLGIYLRKHRFGGETSR